MVSYQIVLTFKYCNINIGLFLMVPIQSIQFSFRSISLYFILYKFKHVFCIKIKYYPLKLKYWQLHPLPPFRPSMHIMLPMFYFSENIEKMILNFGCINIIFGKLQRIAPFTKNHKFGIVLILYQICTVQLELQKKKIQVYSKTQGFQLSIFSYA